MHRFQSQRHFSQSQLENRLKVGLVGHWIGNGSGLVMPDYSGRLAHGTITGPRWILGPNGDQHALYYDGTDDYVAATIAPTLAFPASLTAWIWPERDTGDTNTILDCTDSSTFGWRLGLTTSPTLRLTLTAIADYDSALAPIRGMWNFVGVTVTANSGTASIYLNKASTSHSIGTPLTSPWDRCRIGYRLGNSTPFAGRIGEVRLYNRCLSDVEMKTLADPVFLSVTPMRRRHGKVVAAGAGFVPYPRPRGEHAGMLSMGGGLN